MGRGCAPAAALVRVGVLGSPGSGHEAAVPRGSREELGLGSVGAGRDPTLEVLGPRACSGVLSYCGRSELSLTPL